MIEYYCPDCEVSEVLPNIIPQKKCNKCSFIMDAHEWEGE